MEYLHTMVRVGNVETALDFWCNKLGLVEVRRTENEKARYTLIFLAAPADAGHHYGHGKIEAVAALCEATLLGLLAIAAFVEAARRLVFDAHAIVSLSPYAFAAVAISICVDAARWRTLSVIARETGSDALAADALHFSSDLASSLARSDEKCSASAASASLPVSRAMTLRVRQRAASTQIEIATAANA